LKILLVYISYNITLKSIKDTKRMESVQSTEPQNATTKQNYHNSLTEIT